MTRYCNCDVGDAEYRADAVVLTDRSDLPVQMLYFTGSSDPAASQNVTVGNLLCLQQPYGTSATSLPDR